MPLYAKDKTVFEESLDRIRFIYDNCDEVVVNMSGGKDSTVVFNLTQLVYHNCPAMLCAWNIGIPEHIGTDIEALERLLGEHECVIDPCCGFGNTMLRALKHGKRCIMADVDTECVAYVRKLATELQ